MRCLSRRGVVAQATSAGVGQDEDEQASHSNAFAEVACDNGPLEDVDGNPECPHRRKDM